MVDRVAAPADGENLFDKYAKGARILVEGAKTNTGQTPKEIVWSKNKAKLYHYEPGREKSIPSRSCSSTRCSTARTAWT